MASICGVDSTRARVDDQAIVPFVARPAFLKRTLSEDEEQITNAPKRVHQITQLTDLSVELRLHVLSFLSNPRDLASFAQVSHQSRTEAFTAAKSFYEKKTTNLMRSFLGNFPSGETQDVSLERYKGLKKKYYLGILGVNRRKEREYTEMVLGRTYLDRDSFVDAYFNRQEIAPEKKLWYKVAIRTMVLLGQDKEKMESLEKDMRNSGGAFTPFKDFADGHISLSLMTDISKMYSHYAAQGCQEEIISGYSMLTFSCPLERFAPPRNEPYTEEELMTCKRDFLRDHMNLYFVCSPFIFLTSLHYFAFRNPAESKQIFYDSIRRLKLEGKSSDLALKIAIWRGYLDIAKELVEGGIQFSDQMIEAALCRIVEQPCPGAFEIYELLLGKISLSESDCVNFGDKIMVAINDSKEFFLEKLLEKNAISSSGYHQLLNRAFNIDWMQNKAFNWNCLGFLGILEKIAPKTHHPLVLAFRKGERALLQFFKEGARGDFAADVSEEEFSRDSRSIAIQAALYEERQVAAQELLANKLSYSRKAIEEIIEELSRLNNDPETITIPPKVLQFLLKDQVTEAEWNDGRDFLENSIARSRNESAQFLFHDLMQKALLLDIRSEVVVIKLAEIAVECGNLVFLQSILDSPALLAKASELLSLAFEKRFDGIAKVLLERFGIEEDLKESTLKSSIDCNCIEAFKYLLKALQIDESYCGNLAVRISVAKEIDHPRFLIELLATGKLPKDAYQKVFNAAFKNNWIEVLEKLQSSAPETNNAFTLAYRNGRLALFEFLQQELAKGTLSNTDKERAEEVAITFEDEKIAGLLRQEQS